MILETSIGLDYRASRWGLERIVLDTLQNHLPSDSKGTFVKIEYLKNDKWTELTNQIPFFGVKAIRIIDDGTGYNYETFNYLGSDKTDDKSSVGQFGDGLKMSSAAALRETVDITYHSKNWTATPFAKTEGDKERLCFRIEEHNYEMNGSMTIFTNPKNELKQAFKRIFSESLQFSKEYTTIFETKDKHYCGKILESKTGKQAIFVKGMKFKNVSYNQYHNIFSYDLNLEEIDPDRQYLNSYGARNAIYNLIKSQCDNETLRTILKISSEHPQIQYIECDALKTDIPKPGLNKYTHLGKALKKAFINEFGENALISHSPERDREAKDLDYTVVCMNRNLQNTLHRLGINSTNDVRTSNQEYDWIKIKDFDEEELNAYEEIKNIVDWFGYSNKIEIKAYNTAYVTLQGTKKSIKKDINDITGVHIFNPTTQKELIGFKRSLLKQRNSDGNLEELANTIIHELGHSITKRGDYEREFTNFFTSALAKKYFEDTNK